MLIVLDIFLSIPLFGENQVFVFLRLSQIKRFTGISRKRFMSCIFKRSDVLTKRYCTGYCSDRFRRTVASVLQHILMQINCYATILLAEIKGLGKISFLFLGYFQLFRMNAQYCAASYRCLEQFLFRRALLSGVNSVLFSTQFSRLL